MGRATGPRSGPTTGFFSRHAYAIAAVLVFLTIVVSCWSAFVETDEEIYLLGSRRVADPTFLAADFTWSRLPPTSTVFDHLVAPLWRLGDAGRVANVGRAVCWALLAISLAALAKTLRLPASALVIGFVLWLHWGQTLGICGAPVEGFQPKSLAYPLIFAALVLVMRGRAGWAGACLGLATTFHLVVGGWACLALFLTLIARRASFPRRAIVAYTLAAAAFVLPLVIAGVAFAGSGLGGEMKRQMDEIYVLFAMPHCCDPDTFMSWTAWIRALVVFAIATVLVLAWPERRGAGILGGFLIALVLFFFVGALARPLGAYGLLALYPLQLAHALPALFLFVFAAAWIRIGGAWRRFGPLGAILLLAGTIGLLVDRKVASALISAPGFFAVEIEDARNGSPGEVEPLDAWIRSATPRNSVFVTPFLPGFWPDAERAQVASMRHPPLDRRIVEWKQRLEALNGFRPYARRGFAIDAELAEHERALSVADLIRIRDRYGATHYLVQGTRDDLAAHRLHAADGWSVYDLAGLEAPPSP
jgi:hypothetical protein